MDQPISPVMANHTRPRAQAHVEKEHEKLGSLNSIPAELQPGIKSWTLSERVRKHLADWKQKDDEREGNDSDDDDEDEDDDSLKHEGNDHAAGPGGREEQLKSFRDREGPERDVKDQQAYDSFAEENASYVYDHVSAYSKEGPTEDGTLLHSLARMPTKLSWQVWVKFILDVARSIRVDVLCEKTKRNKTCIHAAIEHGDEGLPFISFICDIEDDKVLVTAIALKTDLDLSCVDLAISEVSPVASGCSFKGFRLSSMQILHELTRKASEDTLSRPRGTKFGNIYAGRGNLPLHDLVHVNVCRDLTRICQKDENTCKSCQKQKGDFAHYRRTYLDVLDLMVKKHPQAMKTMNSSKQSPFLFHCHTSKTSQDRCILEFDKSIDSVLAAKDGRSNAELPPKLPPKKGDPYRPSQGKNGSEPTALKTSSQASEVRKVKHKDPKLVEISRDLVTVVSQKLLELCLSSESFSDVCNSSFGEKFPSAEYIFKADPLTDRTVGRHQKLPLERMLACVEVSLYARQAAAGDSEAQSEEERDTREKLVTELFDWLRGAKQVKRIVQLVIYDHAQAPCRDEVVKACLKGFDVRYLDWNKEDLSIDVLQEVAPNLQKLWLTWSGRKSALHGWANERYGVLLLQKLKKLHVIMGSDWESPETNGRNLKEFRKMLQANNKPDLLEPDIDDTRTYSVDRHNRVEVPGLKESNQWIEAVTKFRDVLNAKFVKLDESVKTAMQGAIKVAIIDDGVDLDGLVSSDYVTGWCPYSKTPDRGLLNAWYISDKKHGTEMARLIQLVWPRLSLYMAKLDTTRRVYKTVAASAAEAINQAVASGAKVISMSWTMYKVSDDPDDEGIKSMMKAIKKAEDNNIIMFCASQDSGRASYREPYPAAERNPNTLKRVGSAGIHGGRSDYVNPKEVDYLFPGEVAMSGRAMSEHISGSSAATALASGLAGLILWCCALQEKQDLLKKTSKPAVKASDVRKELSPTEPLKRTNTLSFDELPNPQAPKKPVNFQNHTQMYGLFTALRSSKDNPLVNITPLLHAAAAKGDPAGEMVRRCRIEIHNITDNPSLI